jgi:hypothetical protein
MRFSLARGVALFRLLAKIAVQLGDAFGLQHPKKIRRRAFHSARASVSDGKF